jgi:hypothetical protein
MKIYKCPWFEPQVTNKISQLMRKQTSKQPIRGTPCFSRLMKAIECRNRAILTRKLIYT